MKAKQKQQTEFKLKTLSTALVVAGVMAGVAMPVAAKKYRDDGYYNAGGNSAYDYAKVVDVAPVIETYKVNQPVEQCWDERVPRKMHYSERRGYRNSGHPRSYTGEILGAIVGAAVGNQFGDGRGKKVATAAGAVLGGSVARDIKNGAPYTKARQRRGDRYAQGYDVVQRCELRDSYTSQERVVGYDVAYKYRGNVFHTQMDQHPGDKIKVMVTVNPV